MANELGNNLVSRAFRPPKITEFPAMYWDPKTGKPKVFNSATEVPAGWLPTHPNNVEKYAEPPAAKTPPAPTALTMTRDEIIAALNAGGVSFQQNAGTKALFNLLRENVISALKGKNIAFDPNADTAVLYTLLTDGPAE